MRVPWTANRCILCLEETSLSKEHIIPKALGGILTCLFLCKDCNSSLGDRVDVGAKKDPRIRFAVDYLQSQLPNFVDGFREGQEFLLHGPGWTERGKVHKGKLQVASRKTEDGALVQPPDESYKSNKRILRKDGISEDIIQERLKRLYEAKENEIVSLAPDRVAVKRSVEKVEPDLSDSKLLTSLLPLKIAYEFLALHLYDVVYEQNPALNELRVALREGVEDHPSFRVEELNASEYKPFHGIGFVENNPHAVVLIRLFGWLAFRVHFRRLTVSGPRLSYKHDLDTNRDEMLVRPADMY